jgi:hypothetical protein
MKKKALTLDLRPELIAIEVAVSILSPVNIQTCTPASLMASIVR